MQIVRFPKREFDDLTFEKFEKIDFYFSILEKFKSINDLRFNLSDSLKFMCFKMLESLLSFERLALF